jgi:hypothetical protein
VRALFAAVLGLIALAAPAEAQFAIELRGGQAIGNHAPARAGLEGPPGLSVSGLAEYAFRDDLAIYGTYTYGEFRCESGFCTGVETIVSSIGGGGGVRVTPYGPLWVRAGLLFTQAFVETARGTFGSDIHPGYELGVGVDVPLAWRFQLTGGAGYRSQFDASERTSLLNAEAGLRLLIGPLSRPR